MRRDIYDIRDEVRAVKNSHDAMDKCNQQRDC